MPSILNATTSTGFTVTPDNSGSLQLATNNGTTAVTIDTSQNVGIGTTSPAAKLNVVGGNVIVSNTTPEVGISSSGSNRYALLYAISTSGTMYSGVNGTSAGASIDIGGISDNATFFGSRSNHATQFISNNTVRATITSGGNLEFASGAGFLQLATNQTMRVPSTGGIGYVGNINSATVFQIAYNSTSAGVQLSSGATSWGTFSDSRLKNITGTYTNALNDIAQIQPVKFTWKSDEDNKPQVGVVAQSVENVVPEAVDSTTIEMDGTEKYLTVRYTELIPLMIASIQELKTELDTVKAELNTLKNPPVEGVA